jgi:CheY-like chemotaxis protein
VRVALDGESAVGVVEAFDPELVFVDLNMPGMDGYETARRVQALPGAERRRLIALTGYGFSTVGARVRRAGFECYVAKPAEVPEIERLLV